MIKNLSPRVTRRVTSLRDSMHQVLSSGFGKFGFFILLGLLAFSLITPALSPDDALEIDTSRRLLTSALFTDNEAAPFFGTDHLGRNLGVMAALGIRTSILIGVGAVALSALFGWIIGSISGFFGGKIDDMGGRLMDLFGAFPGLILIIALVTVLGPSPINLIVVLALVTWETFGRVARASSLSLKSEGFIDAAELGGVRVPRMLLSHVRLNTFAVVVVLGIIQLPRMILAEATLSFLGFGLPVSTRSLGTLIAAERGFLSIEPWTVTFPGIILALLSVGTALFGLGVRESTGLLGVSPSGES